jgi:hypothetical protein
MKLLKHRARKPIIEHGQMGCGYSNISDEGPCITLTLSTDYASPEPMQYFTAKLTFDEARDLKNRINSFLEGKF